MRTVGDMLIIAVQHDSFEQLSTAMSPRMHQNRNLVQVVYSRPKDALNFFACFKSNRVGPKRDILRGAGRWLRILEKESREQTSA
jgi:hypothetical protein